MFQADLDVRSLRDEFVARRVRAVIYTLWPRSSDTSLDSGECSDDRAAGDSLYLKTIDALSKMTNVTEFRVRDDRLFGPHPTPYFALDWPPFCRTLQKLSLVVRAQSIESLRLESMTLCNLEELDLELRFLDDGTTSAPEIVITTVAPFISRLNASLRSLWITTPLDLDNSPFFDLLGFFPKLHNLDISVGISRNSISESPITRFVKRHADTLRSLVFVSDYSAAQEDNECSLQRVWNIFQFSLPHLRSLSLSLHVYPMTGAALMPCISPFVDTLTSIDLGDICLCAKDLAIVTSAFLRSPGMLKSASFRIAVLSPEVLDTLAKNLSGLENLTLRFSDVGGHELDEEGSSTDQDVSSDRISFLFNRHPVTDSSLIAE